MLADGNNNCSSNVIFVMYTYMDILCFSYFRGIIPGSPDCTHAMVDDYLFVYKLFGTFLINTMVQLPYMEVSRLMRQAMCVCLEHFVEYVLQHLALEREQHGVPYSVFCLNGYS